LEAEALFVAEREGEKIAIEIKSFQGQSLVQNLHEAFGKYRLYLYALQNERPDLVLFLAVPIETYNTFFQKEFVQFVIKQDKVNILTYNTDNQTIVSWIIH
jgi:XisH protein